MARTGLDFWAPLSELTVKELIECLKVCTAIAAAMRANANAGAPSFRQEYDRYMRVHACIVERVAVMCESVADATPRARKMGDKSLEDKPIN